MSDIGLFFEKGVFDIKIEDDDFKADDGLEASVAISVFTDRRINEDDLDPLEKDKRGWWGDMFPDEPNDQIGSRLWLLERQKTTTETARRSEDYITESLQWMLEDGVASNISVESDYDENKILIPVVEITRPDGESTRFQVLWEKQELRRL